jgi:hypothetical protein
LSQIEAGAVAELFQLVFETPETTTVDYTPRIAATESGLMAVALNRRQDGTAEAVEVLLGRPSGTWQRLQIEATRLPELGFDEKEQLYVVAERRDAAPSVVSFDSEGELRWVQTGTALGKSPGPERSFVVRPAGGFVSRGLSSTGDGGLSTLTNAHDADGQAVWFAPGPRANRSDSAGALGVSPEGAIALAQHFHFTGSVTVGEATVGALLSDANGVPRFNLEEVVGPDFRGESPRALQSAPVFDAEERVLFASADVTEAREGIYVVRRIDARGRDCTRFELSDPNLVLPVEKLRLLSDGSVIYSTSHHLARVDLE